MWPYLFQPFLNSGEVGYFILVLGYLLTVGFLIIPFRSYFGAVTRRFRSFFGGLSFVCCLSLGGPIYP